MKIINEFYDRIFILYFVFGSITIFGTTLSLFYGLFEINIIAAILFSLIVSFLSCILYGGALIEITDNIQDLKKDTRNTHKRELCNSLSKYAETMPFWVMYRFMKYFNSIPEDVYAPDDKKQEVNNKIEDSVSEVKWILSNESVVDVVYRKYAPEQRSEMIDVVKNTLRDETRVIRDIRKDSERYHKEFLTAKKKRQKENTQRVNRETNQKVSQNASEFLQNYYMNEK